MEQKGTLKYVKYSAHLRLVKTQVRRRRSGMLLR